MHCLEAGSYTVTVRRVGAGSTRLDLVDLVDARTLAPQPITWGRIKSLFLP